MLHMMMMIQHTACMCCWHCVAAVYLKSTRELIRHTGKLKGGETRSGGGAHREHLSSESTERPVSSQKQWMTQVKNDNQTHRHTRARQ
uniref:Putative secreted protein n=1 Tax=Anopheles darlingi TaxID=43151 RepID=A0A2M4DLP7_ANODA